MKIFLIFICLFYSTNCQNDGRYKPTATRVSQNNDGRYRSKNDGKYVHVDNPGGQYTGSSAAGGPGGKFLGVPTTRRPKAPTSAPVAVLQVKPSVAGKGTGEGGSGWQILRDEKSSDLDSYRYLYETENGILAEESGQIEKLAGNDEGIRSQGFYEYTGDDGLLYRVDYVADDNGFVPKGDHIPKPHPTIIKMLQYLATQRPNTRK